MAQTRPDRDAGPAAAPQLDRPSPRYLDLLDTVRTKTVEGQRLAKANLFVMAMSEEPVVVSQTQAFDSSVILEAGVALDGPGFRKLVADRLITVKLVAGVPTVLAAFEAALDRYIDPPGGDPSRRFIFSAWRVDDRETALALRSAARTGRDHGLDASHRENLEGLRRLSATLADLNLREEVVQTFTLAARLRAARESIGHREKLRDLAVLLDVVLPDGLNDRSALHRRITEYVGPLAAIAAGHDLVDLCYNDVVATSLGGRPTMLAAAVPAVEAWALSDHGTAEPMATVELHAYRDLPSMTWKALDEARNDANRYRNPKDRWEVLTARLAREVLDNGVLVRVVNIGGVALAAGAVAAGTLMGQALVPGNLQLGEIAGASGGGALGTLVGKQLRDAVLRRFGAGVEMRLRGLRQLS